MTNTIATYIALNAKKVLLVLGLSMALILSVAVAPAHAASCSVDADCDSDEICDGADDGDDNTDDGTCIDEDDDPVVNGNDPAATQYGLDTYGGSDGIGLGKKPLDDAVVGLINVLLGFLGLIAVVIILIGGFRWMTAGGNEDKVAEARKTIFSGIIGLAIILFAWGITTFVVQEFVKAST